MLLHHAASHGKKARKKEGADANPYLALAAIIGSGMYGVEQALVLPPPGVGQGRLPRSLTEAVELMEAPGSVARAVLGDAFVTHYAHTRRHEVREFAAAVTDWELTRYMEAI